MSAFNLSELVRPNIIGLKPYSSARDEFGETESDKIFLDANENPFDSSVNRYPDPQQWKLKRKLAGIKNVRPEQILLGNGSDEVLDLLVRAFCEPGQDNIISLPPTYGMYKVISGINNVENRTVQLTTEFQPDYVRIMETVNERSKILFLCSPNNPTSNCMNKDVVEQLLQRFNGLVVIDEAYIDFSAEVSWLNSLNDYPNLVITQTFSKAVGMAGIRLGVCYASEEIIKILNKIKPPYNVNELTQREALTKLESWNMVQEQVEILQKERNSMYESLSSVPYIEKVFPSEANFLLIRVDNAVRRYNELLKLGFVVRDRSTQPLCENCLRITIGTPAENKSLIDKLPVS